jgi:hypothetical protein
MPCHIHFQSRLLTASRVCYPVPSCNCCCSEWTPNDGSAIPETVLNAARATNESRSAADAQKEHCAQPSVVSTIILVTMYGSCGKLLATHQAQTQPCRVSTMQHSIRVR